MLVRIAQFSGLTLHHHINVRGVVDEHYHGNMCMIVFTHLDKPFQIYCGERVAQLISQFFLFISRRSKLDDTERGIKGLRSTRRK
jgi:dUTPase